MDRSLDELISERPNGRSGRGEPRGPPRGERRREPRERSRDAPRSEPRGDSRRAPPPRAPYREEYPRDGVRKTWRDERMNFNSDWVHDRYDDEEGYERHQRRAPELERYEAPGRQVKPEDTKIRVDNLHYDLTEDDLRDLFSRIGRVTSVRLLYDRMDRSQGTAFVTYQDYRDAHDAIAEFNGQNAYGQPIRLSLVPTGPTQKPAGSSLFDRVERPPRSLFERIDGGTRDQDDRREDAGRRRYRSHSPRRRPDLDHVDRYAAGPRGSRSPMRRRGTPRESGRRPGQMRDGGGRSGQARNRTDDDGHRKTGGRPRKTAEELDAEMEDYWGGKGDGTQKENGSEEVASNRAAAAGPAEDDVDMIE